MTVSELIEKLKALPQDAPVLTNYGDGLFECLVEISIPETTEAHRIINHPRKDMLGAWVDEGMGSVPNRHVDVEISPTRTVVVL